MAPPPLPGPMSPPLSRRPKSMPQVLRLGPQLPPVDVDIVEVRPVRTVGSGRAVDDGGAVVRGGGPGEPGPRGPDPFQHVRVRVADGREPELVGVEAVACRPPRANGGGPGFSP